MDWFQTYTRIAFQLHAALESKGDMYLVDTYYGPEEWRTDKPPAHGLHWMWGEIDSLRDNLANDVTSDPKRSAYLLTQVRALETICRYLIGEPLTLRDVARDFLDIEPTPVPETVLEENRRMYDEALGGTGTLAERFARFHAQILIQPTDQQQVLALFARALDETRTRTCALLPLPDTESVEAVMVSNVPYGAANWYKGNYHSYMELNADRPISLLRLLLLACHEGYPGHHTESTLKEKFIYQEKGYTEQCLFFNGPQVVVSEGIATLAGSMIFPPSEAAAWLTEEYRALGKSLDGVDLPLLMEAFWAVDPDALGTNVVLRAEAGGSLDALTAYALHYGMNNDAETRRHVTDLYNASLLRRMYQLSYYHGRYLMQPLLQGDDRFEVWRRFLTEPVTPALLRDWS